MVRRSWGGTGAALAIACALASCTTPPATPQAMTASVALASKPNWVVRKAIAVGDVTDASGHSVVTADALRQALEQSLATAGYLAAGSKSHYRLNATLQEIDQPPFTLTDDATVTSTVLYRLVGPGTNAQYSVTASGTATFDDSAIFGKRLQLASERALQANITALLKKLQTF
jgi:hypothetical protein